MPFSTIARPVDCSQKIRRSEFHAFLFPIRDDLQAREIISDHLRDNAYATHNCFGFICGYNQELKFSSDAGEPRGSAGKPILNALQGEKLTFVLAIVTRWFGGVKLGVPGLIEAYGGSVLQAVALAEKIPALELAKFLITADYSLVPQLTRLAASLQGSVTGLNWSERAHLMLVVPESESARLREFLDSHRHLDRLDYQFEPG